MDFKSVYVPSEFAAYETVHAILNTILFVRVLGNVKMKEKIAHIYEKEDPCSYIGVEDETVIYRMDRTSSLVKNAISGMFPVAEIELEFGCFNREELQKRKQLQKSRQRNNPDKVLPIKRASNWASWVADSLAGVGKLAGLHKNASDNQNYLARLSDADERLLVSEKNNIWERWKFRIYVVDAHTYQNNKRPKLAQILQEIIHYAAQSYDRLPPLLTTDVVTYPFRIHVRQAQALTENTEMMARPSSQPMTIGKNNFQTVNLSDDVDDNDDRYSNNGQSNVGWWKSVRFSPGSGTWEDGMGFLKELVQNAPSLSSSPPF